MATRGELIDLRSEQRKLEAAVQPARGAAPGFLVHDLENPVHAIELHAQAVMRASSNARTRSLA
ncbi:MAG TPA: hypothetical protein VLT45_00330 [Kofleriaceae bacterium]|nr:hypothetical protein [Kofleriaceae bacterium]